MNRLSDRGSIPLRSIPEKPLKSSVLAVFFCIVLVEKTGKKCRFRLFQSIVGA